MILAMVDPWTGETSERLRWLAILRLEEGERQEDVADFLGVSVRTVQRWWQAWRAEGFDGLRRKPGSGRPCILDPQQTEQVLDWMDRQPSHFGFPTERWTAPRVAWLIHQHFGLTLNHRYLNDWLRRHGVTPQIPQRQAQERGDETLIQGWLRHQWPRLKKR